MILFPPLRFGDSVTGDDADRSSPGKSQYRRRKAMKLGKDVATIAARANEGL